MSVHTTWYYNPQHMHPNTPDVETSHNPKVTPTVTSDGGDRFSVSPHERQHLVHSTLPVEAELFRFQVCLLPPAGVGEDGEGGALPVGGGQGA